MASRTLALRRIVALCVAPLTLAAARPAQAQASLTGVTLLGTNTSGAPLANYDWYTEPGPPSFAWKVWVVRGTNLNGAFVNGPNASQSDVNIPLTPGNYTFTVFVAHNTLFAGTRNDPPAFGINLCFNKSVAPSIAAYAPTQTSLGSPPPFAGTDASVTTRGYSLGSSFPAPGGLSCRIGGVDISLVDWRMTAMPVYGLRRVGSLSTASNGLPNNVGQFTLRVETATGAPKAQLQIRYVNATRTPGPDVQGNGFLKQFVTVRNIGSTTAKSVRIDRAIYGTPGIAGLFWSGVTIEYAAPPILSYTPWPLSFRPLALGDIAPGQVVTAGIDYVFPAAAGPTSGKSYPLTLHAAWNSGETTLSLRAIAAP